MAQGFKTGGRQKGTPNRFTGEFRTALRLAFLKLGGVDALVDWGRTNPDAFYALCGRLIPAEVASRIRALRQWWSSWIAAGRSGNSPRP